MKVITEEENMHILAPPSEFELKEVAQSIPRDRASLVQIVLVQISIFVVGIL